MDLRFSTPDFPDSSTEKRRSVFLSILGPIAGILCLVTWPWIQHRSSTAAPAATHPAISLGSKISLMTALGGTTSTSFKAPSTLYAIINFPAPVFGTHRLSGHWKRPDGTLHEDTAVDINFPPEGTKRAYLWLRIVEATSGPLFDSPSVEGAHPELNGQWGLEVSMDGLKIAQSHFEINGL